MNKKAFNGTVQVPRPVVLIRAFGQQELPDFFADTKEKRPVCCADQRGLALFGARSEALLQSCSASRGGRLPACPMGASCLPNRHALFRR